MFVLILDYGSGNIKSVYNSVKNILQSFDSFSEVKVSNNLLDLKKADKIILPGVGSFDQCMNRIEKLNDFVETLKYQVIEKKKLFLGICVGMQILASTSDEGELKGFSFIDNSFEKLKSKIRPHIGWNNVSVKKNHYLFNNIQNNSIFYFLHSFCLSEIEKQYIVGETEYENDFISVFEKENIIGIQFHPEKSHSQGQKLLLNFYKN